MKNINFFLLEGELSNLISSNLKKHKCGFYKFTKIDNILDKLSFRFKKYDIFIMQPDKIDKSAFDFIKLLREKYKTHPIIVISKNISKKNQIKFFEVGVDDCIDISCDFDLTLLRIKTRLRIQHADIIIDDFTISPSKNSVTYDGKSIKLNKKSFEILLFLSKHHGEIVSKSRLVSEIWGEKSIHQSIVEVYISYIRKKLNKNIIKTIRKRGYRFLVT